MNYNVNDTNNATFVYTQNKELVNYILKQQSKKDVLTKTLGMCSSSLAYVKRLLLRKDFSKDEVLDFIANCLADYKDINKIIKENKWNH